MPLGWSNALPLELGGGPTDAARIYTALRRAMGQGGAGPEGGIEDLWRQCKARAIADAGLGLEAAVLQAFPGEATELLETWEELLGVQPAATVVERQDAAAAALAGKGAADAPSLTQQIADVAPWAELEQQDRATARVAQLGKVLGARDGSAPFGSHTTAGVVSASFPNYSDHFVERLHATAAPTDGELAALAMLLGDVLPAWVDWGVYVGPTGFNLDGGDDGSSLLDITAFS